MATDPVKNFAKCVVSTIYGTTDTVIALRTGHGAKLPTPGSGSYNLVWYNATDYSDPADDPNVEIVRVTSRSGDILTVLRAQEGTAPHTHNSAGKVYVTVLSFTKKSFDDLASQFLVRLAQVTLPTPAVGQLIIWYNTVNGKVYLVYNDVTAGVKYVELNL